MKLEKRGDGAPQQEPVPDKQEKRDARSARRREISVIVYTTVLFVVALALIALSYFMQQRYNNAITDITAEHGEFTSTAMRSIEELQDSNAQLTKDLQAARDELDEARQKIARLEDSLEDSQAETREAAGERDALQADLENAQKRTEALEALLAAAAQEDPEQAARMLEDMAGLAEYLDGTALEYYNKLLEGAGEPENEQ